MKNVLCYFNKVDIFGYTDILMPYTFQSMIQIQCDYGLGKQCNMMLYINGLF